MRWKARLACSKTSDWLLDPELEFSEAIYISQQHPILVISWQPAWNVFYSSRLARLLHLPQLTIQSASHPQEGLKHEETEQNVFHLLVEQLHVDQDSNCLQQNFPPNRVKAVVTSWRSTMRMASVGVSKKYQLLEKIIYDCAPKICTCGRLIVYTDASSPVLLHHCDISTNTGYACRNSQGTIDEI